MTQSIPPSEFHIPRGSTKASARRHLQRLRSTIDNATNDIVNRAVTTPSGAHACRVYNPTPSSLADATLTDITSWGTESFDVDGWHSLVTNPDRITVNQTGVYFVQSILAFNQAPAAAMKVVLNKNGSALETFSALSISGTYSVVNAVTLIALTSGDYLTVSFFKSNAAGSQGIETTEYDCSFSVALLGTN